MRTLLPFMLPALLLAAPRAGADDPPAAPPNPAEPLLAALQALEGPAAWRFEGKASSVSKDPDAQMGGATVVVAGGGDLGAAEVEGPIEALRTSEGELLLVTKGALPGAAVYARDGRVVVRTTYEDEPVAATNLAADVGGVLEGDALRKAVAKSALERTEDAATGRVTWSGTLHRSLHRAVRQRVGMLAAIQPKVLRIEARFVVGKDGALRSMRLSVVRTNPFGDAMRDSLAGGSGTKVMPDEPSEEEGKTSVYALERAADAPSPRALEELAALRKVVGGA
jgi:hypothetical protein